MQDNYITSPSRVYTSSPAPQRGSDMLFDARSFGNAASSDVPYDNRTLSPQSVKREITNVFYPPDLSPVQRLMKEMKDEIRVSLADLRQDLLKDMSVLQQEVLKNRSYTINQSDVLLQEMQTMHVELAEVCKANQEPHLADALKQQILDISRMSYTADQRLARLQHEIMELRSGRAESKVMLQPGTMQRVFSWPSIAPHGVPQPPPRVVQTQETHHQFGPGVGLHGPNISFPAGPHTGYPQAPSNVKVAPTGYPQEALATVDVPKVLESIHGTESMVTTPDSISAQTENRILSSPSSPVTCDVELATSGRLRMGPTRGARLQGTATI